MKVDPFEMRKETSGEEISCATMLKALADETRLAVVRQLLTNPQHVGEIQVALGIEQSLLSHHLKLLRDAGIVESERDGKSVLYRLASSVELRRRGNIIDLGCCQLSFPSGK
jgi:DNA-binding transcriptional ArsR family regulator